MTARALGPPGKDRAPVVGRGADDAAAGSNSSSVKLAPGPANNPVTGAVVGVSAAELAETANREHALAGRAAVSMVEHAVRAGDALLAAKQQVRHGQWLPWLDANFEGSARTAQQYMRLAGNAKRVAHLPPGEQSLTGALAAIAEPKKKRAPANRRPTVDLSRRE